MDSTATNMRALSQIRDVLFETEKPMNGSPSSSLRTPRVARQELQVLKDQFRELQDYKEQARFLGKRDRIMRSGWRHGIVGVDDADSAKT